MSTRIKALVSLFLFCLLGFTISAQKTSTSDRKKSLPPKTISKNLDYTIKKDTSIHEYFYIDDVDKKYIFKDTMVSYQDVYNPATIFNSEHLTLGNLGSAAIPIRYKTYDQIGIRSGIEQYDLYNYTLDSIRLHQLNKPFNDLYFSPVNSQENFLVKATFARQFSDGISFHFDYNRIKQEGFYSDQATLTTNLSSSIFYESNDGKRVSLLTMIINNNNEENNGGVTGGDIGTLFFDAPVERFYEFGFFRVRTRIPTILTNADSRKEQKIYSWLNRYHLFKSKTGDTDLYLQHQIDYEDGNFRSSDVTTNASSDSLFYKDFLVDSRGLRYAVSNKSISNRFTAGFKKSNLLRFRTGLKHSWHRYDLGGENINFNEVVLSGNLSTQKGIFSLNGKAELGLVDVAGDIMLNGFIGFTTKYLRVNGGINSYRYTPSIKHQTSYVNNVKIWDNDFEKPFGTELFGSIDIPLLNVSGSVSQLVETNTLYWDSLFIPRQLNDVLSVTRLELEQKLSLGILHLDSRLMLQLISKEEIALPKLLWNERLYIQGKVFKSNLEVQMGLALNFIPDFNSKSYFPLTGSFGNTEEQLLGYPLTNAFINAKVSSFRVFFHFENINDFLIPQPYYQVAAFPQYDFNFRFGIRWILEN